MPAALLVTNRLRFLPRILAGFALLLLGMLCYLLWLARQDALARSEVAARNYAKVLQVRLDGILQRIEAVSRITAKSVSPDMLRLDAASPRLDSVNTLLDDQIFGFPEISGIRVSDARGDLRYASGGLPAKPVNSVDRDFFIDQRDHPAPHLFFSKVVQSRINNKDVVVISRGLRDTSGHFYGIVSTGLDLAEIRNQFQQVSGGNSAIFLRRTDNYQLVARWPHLPEQVGSPLHPDHPTVRNLQQGKREFSNIMVAQTDGVDRVVGIVRLEHYPFYVGIALALDDALVQWKRQAIQLGVSAAGLLLLMWLMMVRLLKTHAGEVRALAELARNQRRLGLLAKAFEYSGEAIVLLDGQQNIVEINRTCTILTGYEFAELNGKSWRALFDDMPEADQVGRDSVWQGEVLCRRKDGNQFCGLITRSCILDEEAALQYLILNFSDISERKRVDRLKSEFVSTVSHELRTPLTSIAGALGLVTGGAVGELPPKARDLLDIAKRNSAHLARMINDLLDIEKLEAGKLTLTLTRQALMPLVEAALESNLAYASGYQVTQQIVQRCDELMVQVDAQRLQQVLLNLLSNAAKFSPRGGKVDVRVMAQDGRARVEVSDYGAGVPEAFASHIFEKFAQADAGDTRKQSGTGLGLAISRQLIEQMGGSIGFVSPPGQGATFYFELPQDNG
jgi:PAS domain S-box-containing protein